MCDTIVALPDATAEKITLFGKNSDREPNEAQAVELFAATDHKPGTQVECTYITIPQVHRTHAVLLCRPFWMWGAEMGANEHGVVIGNEAVFSCIPSPEKAALLGMDLLRLGLERGSTAVEALEVMTVLLERYGQGGNCSRPGQRFYHNSFIIADPNEAFVLETVGPEWFVEPVRSVRAISNAYTTDSVKALADSDRDMSGRTRCSRSSSLLHQREGHMIVPDIISILRDHGTDPSICVHVTDQKPGSQTANSLVSELGKIGAIHWVTGTAVPCTSIFKPVVIGIPLPSHGPQLTDHADPSTLWWRHHRLHRAMLDDAERNQVAVCVERDVLEADMRSRVRAVLNGGNAEDRTRVIAECWKEAMAMEDRWLASMVSARDLDLEDFLDLGNVGDNDGFDCAL